MAEIGLLMLFLVSLINEGREGLSRIVFLIGMLHYIAADYVFHFTGYSYYLSSAAACLMAVIILTSIKNKTELHIDLSMIFASGMVLNFVGWGMYEAYMEPWYYNGAFGLFYLILIIRLLIRKGKDGMGRNTTFSSRMRAVLSIPVYSLSQDKKG